MGCVGYVDDLDHFIDGQICFDEIQGCIEGGVPIKNAIISTLQEASFYSKEEHELYEKLCYSYVLYVLHALPNCPPCESYALYLAVKEECSPHKLDWNGLQKKIKETGMNQDDMRRGEDIYTDYKKSGRDYVLPPDDDY